MSSALLDGYLDHAATAMPKAPGVVEAVADCLRSSAGNPGRGGHRLAVSASRIVEDARERAARLLGGDPERTIFGPGATALLNTVLASRLGSGDRVVVSALEHNAVMRPLRALERRIGIHVRVLRGADPTGVPSGSEVAAAVAEEPTRLVVVTHASNVSGAVLPVAEIVAAVAPVPVLVDGAQAAGSLPVDVSALGAAAWVCSAHKGLLAPPGLGLLLLAPGFEVEPLVLGGTGSHSDSEEMPDTLPDRLEAGTLNVPAIAGLAAACRWLEAEGVAAVHHRCTALTRAVIDELRGGGRVRVIEAGTERVATFSLTVEGSDNGEIAARLDREHGLMLRAGLHCAPAAHRRLGTFPDGTLRVGIGPFTPQATLERLVSAIRALDPRSS